MQRTWAMRAVWTLVILFVLGAIDYLTPLTSVIPTPFAKLAAAILIGVAIGSILQGLRENGNHRGGGGRGASDAGTGVLDEDE